ncbi:hypothetical protein IWQ61_001342 [Dispira simplex]|nr:hypothetical protein IWQ61_001342 [Dispira simplex]
MATSQPLTWLSLLQHHPVFTDNLPDQPRKTNHPTEGLVTPPRDSAEGETGTQSADAVHKSIQDLSEELATLQNPDWYPTQGGYARLTTHALAVRGHELVVVVQGVQIRMVNLKRCKDAWLREQITRAERIRAITEESEATSSDSGTDSESPAVDPETQWLRECASKVPYTILDYHPSGFAIRSVVVSESGRFLAVVGQHQVVVVRLPLPGYQRSSPERQLSCAAYLVGSTYHNPRGSTQVVKVQWHPLSASGTHLMVLTSDGTLRMYDIAENLAEPEQTHYFGPPETRGAYRRVTRLFGSDLEMQEAVSFSLGYYPRTTSGTEQWADQLFLKDKNVAWALFTVYVLMKNGDVYSLTPFMPQKSLCVRAVVDQLALAVRFVFETNSAQTDVDRFGHYMSTAGPNIPLIHPTQLMFTKEWVARLRDTMKSTGIYVGTLPSGNASLPGPRVASQELVRLQEPTTMPMVSVPVGPYLLKPSPPELTDDGLVACDILTLKATPVTVVGVAFSHGQVDLYLQLQPFIPCWTSPAADLGHIRTEHEYLLGSKLPVLATYETLDLGLTTSSPGDNDSLIGNQSNNTDQDGPNAPQVKLVADPLYPTTFYCYHGQGAHCVNISPWYEKLQQLMEPVSTTPTESSSASPDISEFAKRGILSDLNWVVCTIPSSTGSVVPCPLAGMLVLEDIYLSYSLVMLTQSHQLVGIELVLRYGNQDTKTPTEVAPSRTDIPDPLAAVIPPSDTEREVYIPNLPNAPFQVPTELEQLHQAPVSTLVSPPQPSSGGVEVTEENVTFMGERIKELHKQLGMLIKTDALTQSRIQLQMAEHTRQTELVIDHTRKLHSDLLTKRNALKERAQQAQNTQHDLSMRYDQVLQKLLDINQPVVTVEERAYFTDLKRLNRLCQAGDGFEASLKALKQGLKSIKQQATASTTSPSRRGGRNEGSDTLGETSRGTLLSPSVLGTTPSCRWRSASVVLSSRRSSLEPFTSNRSGLGLINESLGHSEGFGQGSMMSEGASPPPSFNQIEANLETAQNVIGQVCSLANDLQRRINSIQSN